MFCYQCKNASGGCGCVVKGDCGKDANCAILQDLLIQMTLGIGAYISRANELDVYDGDIDDFIQDALIATMTGVNHDSESIRSLILESVRIKQWAQTLFEIGCTQARTEPYNLSGAWNIEPADDLDALLEQSWQYAIPLRRLHDGEEAVNLQEMILYGVKGIAKRLRQESQDGHRDLYLAAKMNEILDFLANSPDDLDLLRKKALETGRIYLAIQESLREENRQLSPRFEKMMEIEPCENPNLSLRLDGESELSDALRFIRSYHCRWLKDCEQKTISEWSADRVSPLDLSIDFYWDSQESISFFLAVKSLGIENIRLIPQPGFMKICPQRNTSAPEKTRELQLI